MLDDPLLFSAVMLKMYSKPATKSWICADVVSVLLTETGCVVLFECSVNMYVTEIVIKGSPPVWM